MRLTSLVIALASGVSFGIAPAAHAECLQDQYGNTWDITLDTVNKSITGVATINQRGGLQWVISGSYVGGSAIRIQQLTVSDSEISQTMYMLKGRFPGFAWYYNGAYGGQEANFVACGSAVGGSSAAGGFNR